MAGYAAGVGDFDKGGNAETSGLESLILTEELESLRAAVLRLEPEQSKVLAWKFGLDGGPPRSITWIALRQRVKRPAAEAMLEEALDELRGLLRA